MIPVILFSLEIFGKRIRVVSMKWQKQFEGKEKTTTIAIEGQKVPKYQKSSTKTKEITPNQKNPKCTKRLTELAMLCSASFMRHINDSSVCRLVLFSFFCFGVISFGFCAVFWYFGTFLPLDSYAVCIFDCITFSGPFEYHLGSASSFLKEPFFRKPRCPDDIQMFRKNDTV